MDSRRTLCMVLTACAIWAPFRAQADDVLPPQIVHEACEYYPKGKKFEIIARFYDDSPIFDPKVVYRSGKDEAWKNAPFAKSSDSEDFRATIRAKDLRGPLEYFIETFDENGNGPARMGSPEAPIKVMPSENPPPCEQVGEAEPPAVFDGKQKPPPGAPTSVPGSVVPPTVAPAATPRAEPTPQFTATQGTPPPPPPTDECSQADAPITCSAAFWVGISAGIVVVATGAAFGIAAAAGAFEATPPPSTQRDFVAIVLSGADPTTAIYPLSVGGP